MFKFFRKFRRQLLTEGKAGTYLKYALGEIVLVVIGILIALQINDWNEDRLDRELEREYLVSMLSDLREDRREIEDAIAGNSIMLAGMNDLLTMLSTPQPDLDFQRKLLVQSAVRTYWYITVEFSGLTMSQLKSSGGLRLIRDKQVTDAMLKYEQGVEQCRHQSEELRNYFHTQEASQKLIFNLALGRQVYERIEENYLNMLDPVDSFLPLVREGPYLVNDDPSLMSNYYGDVLFYRTALNVSVWLLKRQKEKARLLIELIENRYGLAEG
jgi:hypothetical protein